MSLRVFHNSLSWRLSNLILFNRILSYLIETSKIYSVCLTSVKSLVQEICRQSAQQINVSNKSER